MVYFEFTSGDHDKDEREEKLLGVIFSLLLGIFDHFYSNVCGVGVLFLKLVCGEKKFILFLL